MTKAYAEVMEYIRVIEAAGGEIFSDACPVWLLKRLKEGQPRVIATDSAKLTSTMDMHRAEGKHFGFFYGSPRNVSRQESGDTRCKEYDRANHSQGTQDFTRQDPRGGACFE